MPNDARASAKESFALAVRTFRVLFSSTVGNRHHLAVLEFASQPAKDHTFETFAVQAVGLARRCSRDTATLVGWMT
jgi:hypothetical protein